MVMVLIHRQRELSFAVRHPDTQFVTAQRSEHDAVVLRDVERDECAFKFPGIIVHHVCLFPVCCLLFVQKSEFNHQLTSVADTQRESVRARIESFERLFGFRVVEECSCPSFGTAQHVAVGKAAAEDNHVDRFQCLASCNQVGHHHVLHVEACQIE